MYAAHIYSYVWYIILPWLWEKKYINKKVNKQSNKQAGYLKFLKKKYIYISLFAGRATGKGEIKGSRHNAIVVLEVCPIL